MIIGLAIAGAVVGALAGVVTAGLVGMLWGGFASLRDFAGVATIGGRIGATCGTVLAPLASFAFMRHVPLGHQFAGTAAGTIVGGVAALMSRLGLYEAIAVGVVGFLTAGAALAGTFRNRQHADAMLPDALSVRPGPDPKSSSRP
jgi:hypothetical protein